jgi:NADPH2:quinone reductase
MRAVVIHENGGPDVLRLEDRPAPEPGEYDLLVAVHATSVNPVDAKFRSRPMPRPFPATLGFDVSGVVESCGSRVTGWQAGDEVFGCPSLMGNGANAELVLLDARAAARKPKSIDHYTAAALPLVSLTAWESLHERARIEAGQTVMVHAGAGGVGHIGVQLARLQGCRVITTASRPESIAFCRDTLRADEVIDYKQTDVVARVNELTGNKGLPVVFDTVGGDNFKRSIECVAALGQLVTILGADAGDRAQLLLNRGITVHYEFMGVRVAYGIQPEKQGAILRSIAQLVDNGLLRPHVSLRLPLEKVAEGHRQIESGRTIGKVVIAVR